MDAEIYNIDMEVPPDNSISVRALSAEIADTLHRLRCAAPSWSRARGDNPLLDAYLMAGIEIFGRDFRLLLGC